MKKEEQLKLAKRLRLLADKLKGKSGIELVTQINWTIGNLEGIAEVLELTAGEGE